jgi:glycosyltransferase involved in cell wall biosynthesis
MNLEGEEGPGFVFGQIRHAIEEAGIPLKYRYFPIKNLAEFDVEAAKEIDNCDVFIGGLGSSYHQMKKAKKLGAKTLLLRFSTHHLHQQRVLQQLYALYKRDVFPNGMYNALKEYKLSDYFLVLSEYCKYTYVLNGVSPDQVFVVPPGMDTEKFSFAEPHTDPFRVLFVGTNPIRKGLPYLLNAWEELVAEGLKGELVVHSDIGHVPVENTTLITQWLSEDELVDLYHQCSVTVLPSLEEGFAASNLESMACGRPIIATNVTGAEDIIEDYKEGILIPPCDVKAIKKAILYCYDNPTELVRMGANARRTAEEYTWARFRLNIAEIVKGLNSK